MGASQKFRSKHFSRAERQGFHSVRGQADAKQQPKLIFLVQFTGKESNQFVVVENQKKNFERNGFYVALLSYNVILLIGFGPAISATLASRRQKGKRPPFCRRIMRHNSVHGDLFSGV